MARAKDRHECVEIKEQGERNEGKRVCAYLAGCWESVDQLYEVMLIAVARLVSFICAVGVIKVITSQMLNLLPLEAICIGSGGERQTKLILNCSSA